MHPEIADPAGWQEIFCTALVSQQHRAKSPARWSVQLGLHLRHFDDTFPLASSVWSTRRPAFHCQNTPTTFRCGRRSSFTDPATVAPLAIPPAAYPGPPTAGSFSGVAENTPGNKLSWSVLNLFPSRAHIFVLGNCLSSSTATPPSEHTPLRRRCCSEPFFECHRHSAEADRPRPIAGFL
jgi:hypothetical protein